MTNFFRLFLSWLRFSGVYSICIHSSKYLSIYLACLCVYKCGHPQTSTCCVCVCVCVCVFTLNVPTALALCCCVTILPQTSQHKTAQLLPHNFCGSGVRAGLWPLLRGLLGCRQDAVGCWLGRDRFQAHVVVVTFSSLWAVGLRASRVPSAASSAPGLMCFPNGATCFFKASKAGGDQQDRRHNRV